MNEQSHEKNISKCCANPAFKPQPMADPAGTLKVSAVEDTAAQFTFVIPARPAELSDEMLDGVVGGLTSSRDEAMARAMRQSGFM